MYVAPHGLLPPYSLVDVILDGQQVVTHSLESEFMQHRGGGVKATVQNEELGASFVRTLPKQRANGCC